MTDQTRTAAEQPIHYSIRTSSRSYLACQWKQAGDTNPADRSTRYPALVTCRACMATFSKDERRTAAEQPTEPEDC